DISLLLLPLGGEVLPRLLQGLMAIGCGVVLWDLGSFLGKPAAGAAAGICFAVTPLVGLMAAHAGTDIAHTLFVLLALNAFMRSAPRWPSGRISSRLLLMSGL